jgi:hypothetical protein
VSPSASLERRVERREEIWDEVLVTRLEYQELMVTGAFSSCDVVGEV